jgi:hypothetical protein
MHCTFHSEVVCSASSPLRRWEHLRWILTGVTKIFLGPKPVFYLTVSSPQKSSFYMPAWDFLVTWPDGQILSLMTQWKYRRPPLLCGLNETEPLWWASHHVQEETGPLQVDGNYFPFQFPKSHHRTRHTCDLRNFLIWVLIWLVEAVVPTCRGHLYWSTVTHWALVTELPESSETEHTHNKLHKTGSWWQRSSKGQ